MSTLPVAVLSGFLGAGKTTLLNRILSKNHGRKIAVIENEFGEAGIDNDLLVESAEQVVVMNNGCICCTVRGDLVRILGEIGERRAAGELDFERVIIRETRAYDSERLNAALDVLATTLGDDLLRYKGILNLVGNPHKIAFQGAHMIMGGTELRPWREDEARESVMVFSGRNLPENSIRRVFETCVTT